MAAGAPGEPGATGARGLHAEEAERGADAATAGAQRGGDVGGPGQAQETHGQVPQRGHDLGRVARADLGAIFVEDAIAHVMHPVLDRPVAADEGEQPRGRRRGGGEAGDAVADLGARVGAIEGADVAFDAEDLLVVGEVGIADQLRARPDAARLEAPVALIDRGVLRGG